MPDSNSCRFCGSKELETVLDLGSHPLSNSFLTELDRKEEYYPLKLVSCTVCGLAQLSHIVNPELIFNSNYVYHTGKSEPIINHAKFLESNYTKFKGKNNFIVEIGSNDGTVLKEFIKQHRVLGIEPCENIAQEAREDGIPTLSEFFDSKTAQQIVEFGGHADLVLLRNVFAHIPDIHEVMRALQILLNTNGIIEIEAPWLLNIIKHVEFDTIYHEHYSYLSLKAVKYLMNMYGFEVFDVKELEIHGGALLYYIGTKGHHTVSKYVLDIEKEEELIDNIAYEFLRSKTVQVKNKLNYLFDEVIEKDKKVVCLGAPAKGNTLLNYCKITSNDIDYCTDTTLDKQCKYTPGSHIPVYSEDRLREDKIDYLLILAWNFVDYILTKPEIIRLRQNGTKIIVPIPEVKII